MDSEPGLTILGEAADRDRLLSSAATIDRLAAQGVRFEPAARFADLLAAAAGALDGDAPAIALVSPGRIEVLGKHTDYCGGRSLLAAVELGIAVVAQPRKDRRIHISNATLGESVEFDFSADLEPRLGHSSNYPMTVARRLARNFPGPLIGANIALASNLPPAAGMSSSSALVTGIFLALAAIDSLDDRPIWRELLATREQLAGYCGTIENGESFGPLLGDKGVGTFGGSEDHVAILCAVPGHLVQYSFCPIRREAVVPMPVGYTFVIMDSGVIAEKTGAALEKYNAISLRAARILELRNLAQPKAVATLAEAFALDSPTLPRLLLGQPHDSELMDRLVQFGLESEMNVPSAVSALREGDLTEFKAIVCDSQLHAESCLGNQIPATVGLVRLAAECGAVAATSFGAGFGGSVWAMVEIARAAEFAAEWTRKYAELGGCGRAFVSGAGTGVVWV